MKTYPPDVPATAAFDAQAITPVGGSQPHTNMQPSDSINYVIWLFGIYPSQT